MRGDTVAAAEAHSRDTFIRAAASSITMRRVGVNAAVMKLREHYLRRVDSSKRFSRRRADVSINRRRGGGVRLRRGRGDNSRWLIRGEGRGEEGRGGAGGGGGAPAVWRSNHFQLHSNESAYVKSYKIVFAILLRAGELNSGFIFRSGAEPPSSLLI